MSPKRLIALMFMVAVLLGMFGFVAMMVTGAGRMIHSLDEMTESGEPVQAGVVALNGDLEGLSVSGPIKIVWIPGDKTTYEVKAEKDTLHYVKTRFDSGDLHFSVKDKYVRGDVTIVVHGKQPEMLSMAGSGNAKLEELKGGSLELSIAGSSTADLKGVLDSLDTSIAGSGNVRAESLKVKKAEVSIAGSGNMSVDATEDLDVSIMGSGDVSYKGSPNLNQNIAGSGRIHKID